MSSRAQYRARVRWLQSLALIGIIAWVAGCRSAPAPGGKYYVRLDALLPLHPGWAQVVSLQSVSGVVQTAPAQATALHLPTSPLPAAFPAPVAVPPNLEQERRQRIVEDARRRLAALAEELRRRNAERSQAEERLGQRELAARLAAARVALEAALPAQLDRIARAFETRLTPLNFKEIVFRTQVRGFTGQPRQDAQTQLQAVLDEIARLNQERDTQLAEARAQVQRQLDADRAQWTRELADRLAKYRRQLETLAAQQVAREQTGLNAAAEPIPPLSSLAAPTASTAPPLQPPTEPNTGAVFGQAQAQVNVAVRQQQADLAAQKAQMIAALRDDTQQAVLQIARQGGWTLVAQGVPGARDGTDTVAKALRAQWQPRSGT